MMLGSCDVEAHQAAARQIGEAWLFGCSECSFEANYFPDMQRFEVLVAGDPFVKHVCHHSPDEVGIRELVEELELDFGEVEVEY